MVFIEKSPEKFDVAIVGGGPAGIMAALQSADSGAKVILIEKNKSLGKKLLLTGKGRCNLTCAVYENREFIEKIGKNGRFLFSATQKFGPLKVINFFEKKGLKLKEERGKRIFPVSDDAEEVLSLLVKLLKEKKVNFKLGQKVADFKVENGEIQFLEMKNGEKVYAKKYILCTGGKSYPTTGSTGDGYTWAEKMGHKVEKLFPSLVSIEVEEDWVKKIEGTSLKNVKFKIFQDNKKKAEYFGEMLFTYKGVSGPIVLNASRDMGEMIETGGKVSLEVDLKPALDFEQLDLRLQRDFKEKANRDFKNYLPDLVPKSMVDFIMFLSGLNSQRKLFEIQREERKNLVKILKGIRMTVKSLGDYQSAVVTKGGVSLKEVDPKTMQSKKIKNLFLAGEVLDLDGPTGGYNLQICWSTGFVAGSVYNIE